MKRNIFYALLIGISLLGLLLRIHNYDRIPPFGETEDEFAYPWAGMTLLQTGVPTSWSPFISYPTEFQLKLWGETFPMVSPYIEKPFLYPILTGGWVLLTGGKEFSDVRLATLRLVPMALSVASIFFLGLFAKNLFGKTIAIIGTIVYATIPTIVMANRMSLTENLLIPLSLLALWLLTQANLTHSKFRLHLLGVTCGLAILTKQSGLSLPLTILILLGVTKRWQEVKVVGLYAVIFGLIHPLVAAFYDWPVYLSVTEELRRAHALGLPEAIYTLFRTPGIGHKESIFLDGAMLAGFILFFSSPFWLLAIPSLRLREGQAFDSEAAQARRGELRSDHNSSQPSLILREGDSLRKLTFLLFPFVYITTLSLLEGGTTWYGWHLFPLYPFLTILLAMTLVGLFNNPNMLQLLFFVITIGASSLRFMLLLHSSLKQSWQTLLGSSLIVILTFWFLNKGKYHKKLLVFLFAIFILINIYTVLNSSSIYPTRVQPLASNKEINP